MPVKKFSDYLDHHKINYVTIDHPPACTAQEIAASSHVSGNKLAKTVMVRINGELSMAVLPAPLRVDVDRLRQTLDANHVEIASEKEFQETFPECEVGAMPPFGNLYGMKVFVSEHLANDKDIAFNAGTLKELIQVDYKDFESLVQPKVVEFSYQGD